MENGSLPILKGAAKSLDSPTFDLQQASGGIPATPDFEKNEAVEVASSGGESDGDKLSKIMQELGGVEDSPEFGGAGPGEEDE